MYIHDLQSTLPKFHPLLHCARFLEEKYLSNQFPIHQPNSLFQASVSARHIFRKIMQASVTAQRQKHVFENAKKQSLDQFQMESLFQ